MRVEYQPFFGFLWYVNTSVYTNLVGGSIVVGQIYTHWIYFFFFPDCCHYNHSLHIHCNYLVCLQLSLLSVPGQL